MQRWQVGDVEISSIVEDVAGVPAALLLPQSTAAEVEAISWLKPNFVNEQGFLLLAVQALIVRTPAKLIVVDTCVGNGREGRSIPTWNNLQKPFLEILAAAGVKRDKVDVVLCTHLHPDHVGWNTMWDKGAWVPTFPNAQYLIGKTEFDHWHGQKAESAEVSTVFKDSIEPILSAGLFTMVASDHRICQEVALVSTPGHTPGHVSVRISSKGKEALITGDFIHHPAQMAHPEWTEFADVDPALGERTRQKALAECADKPILVIGTHFPKPAGGHVLRDRGSYRFKT